MKQLMKRFVISFKKKPQTVGKKPLNVNQKRFNNEHDDYYDEPYDCKNMWIEHLERRYRHF